MKTKTLFIAVYIICNTVFTFAQTNVSGGIYSNTVWTIANSPYIVVDTVVVFQNVRLTIEPGVIVKFNANKYMEVRGSIKAQGTNTDTISFTSASILPMPYDWVGINISGQDSAIFRYCKFQYSTRALRRFGSGPKIICNNSSFLNNLYGILANYDINIDSCYFKNNSYGVSHGRIVNGSTFIDNDFAVYAGWNILNSTFCGNNIAIAADQGINKVDGCIITKNNIGVTPYAGYAPDTVINNFIYDNNIGMRHANFIRNNSICKNHLYNYENSITTPIDISNNCWCEVDSTIIASKIYDGYDNTAYGLADFIPFILCDTTVLPTTNFCPGYGTSTSINLLSGETNLFQSYPNPFNDYIIISLEKMEYREISIKIYNTLGQEVKGFENSFEQKQIIDTRNFSKGLYLIKIIKGNVIIGQSKMIKQ